MSAFLYLATGQVFPGEAVGYHTETIGEIVLYQSRRFHYEILTDPVYHGRIVVSDAHQIENRWPQSGEIESYSPHLKALVFLGSIRKSPLENEYYNLRNYLATNMVTGFSPEEPEKLLALLQKHGVIFGAISNRLERSQELVSTYKNTREQTSSAGNRLDNINPIRSMSSTLDFVWDITDKLTKKDYIVVAYDLGLPYSLLRNLSHLGCDMRVVPPDYAPEETIALKPEGILLAGGAGQPERMKYAIANF
jgi:carbamoyl-phosphate synthase small subunit